MLSDDDEWTKPVDNGFRFGKNLDLSCLSGFKMLCFTFSRISSHSDANKCQTVLKSGFQKVFRWMIVQRKERLVET